MCVCTCCAVVARLLSLDDEEETSGVSDLLGDEGDESTSRYAEWAVYND